MLTFRIDTQKRRLQLTSSEYSWVRNDARRRSCRTADLVVDGVAVSRHQTQRRLAVAAMLASETVTPLFENENNVIAVGTNCPVLGIMRSDPDLVIVEAPVFIKRNELLGAIVYPFSEIIAAGTASVPGSKKRIVPVSAVSVGLTRITWVFQPPPSAKWAA